MSHARFRVNLHSVVSNYVALGSNPFAAYHFLKSLLFYLVSSLQKLMVAKNSKTIDLHKLVFPKYHFFQLVKTVACENQFPSVILRFLLDLCFAIKTHPYCSLR